MSESLSTRRSRLCLLLLVPALGIQLGCSGAGKGDDSGRPEELNRKQIIGAWEGAGSREAEFSGGGSIRLHATPCEDVFTSGAKPVDMEGKWEVRARIPDMVENVWIGLEFPAGTCGNKGVSESGFYASVNAGELTLHLRDPDMLDKQRSFHKASGRKAT
ncbi:hypothetical protein [Streptomyces sp. NPDC054866]